MSATGTLNFTYVENDVLNHVSHKMYQSVFQNTQKTSKNMNFIFCKLKNLEKHESQFLQDEKTSKNMNFIFCKLKKPQKA